MLKRAAPEELIHAIRVVAAGGMYLDPTVAVKVVGGFVKPRRQGAPRGPAELSEREAEVARLTAAGHSNKEIAARLDLSVKTVETYRARSLEKLGLKSRAELVRYAVQQGWLPGRLTAPSETASSHVGTPADPFLTYEEQTMRKSFITPGGQDAATPEDVWLDLEQLARVEVTSEDPRYPIEAAFVAGREPGWRPGGPACRSSGCGSTSRGRSAASGCTSPSGPWPGPRSSCSGGGRPTASRPARWCASSGCSTPTARRTRPRTTGSI